MGYSEFQLDSSFYHGYKKSPQAEKCSTVLGYVLWSGSLSQHTPLNSYHDRCYNQNENVQKNLPFSAPDPNQGCEPARKKFV